MDKVDITIIGAGVVGLAIAEKLSHLKKEIILLERNSTFGQEISSRNSEVIHGGIYYPTTYLKTKLCVEGNQRLYELSEKNSIPYKKVGKLIISNTDEETEKIHTLFNQAKANSVKGLSLLTKSKIKDIEPYINAQYALYSQETGIIDTHQLMKYYETNAEKQGVIIAYNCNVLNIEKDDVFTISAKDADNEEVTIKSEIVINCAGLNSDKIAQMAGVDINKERYKIYPCKGEYFSISNRHKNKCKHLVYPAPTPISLGIHTVIDLNESLKLGPSAFYIDNIDYDINTSHKIEFYQMAKTYLPFLEPDDLSPNMSGISRKLQGPNEDLRDFIIREESDLNLPGLINLLGIESPGLTSAPAIAEYVKNLIIN